MDVLDGSVQPIAPAPGLDALGYDSRDGLLYGVASSAVDGTAPTVQAIDPRDGTVLATAPLPQDTYTAGAVSADGLFYVRGRRTIRVVDVTDPKMRMRVVRTFAVRRALLLDDFAVRPKDGLIYGVDDARHVLVRIDPRTERVTRLGRLGVGPLGVGSLGVGRVSAAFFDAAGTFRIAGDRMVSVDVAKLKARARVDARRVAVLSAHPPALVDGAGCLAAVPRVIDDLPSPQVAPSVERLASSR
ncbi:DUF6923 family protein [Actinomadura gamaensis]|uniref:DUF6923 family protein n=1 Tax=Actinomadura gamaensis TaxID=1763541 RepID=A0ABV9UBA7_9ACTN